MLAVSRNLARLKDKLRETGELSNTYLILTSDNGYHLGQHRLGAGKMTAYEEDMRVPLAISGPGVASGGAKHMVLNTDLAPTIAALAGAAPGIVPDGRSFASLLPDGRSGITPDGFRRRFMEENWRGPVPTPTGTKPFPAPTNFAVRGLDVQVQPLRHRGDGVLRPLARPVQAREQEGEWDLQGEPGQASRVCGIVEAPSAGARKEDRTATSGSWRDLSLYCPGEFVVIQQG